LDEPLVKQALGDAHPGVREHAVILAEKYPAFLPELIKRMNDHSPQVAYQASLSVGQFADKESLAALAGCIEKHADNASYRLSILSSNAGSSSEMARLLSKGSFFKSNTPGKIKFWEDYAYVAGARNSKSEIAELLELLADPAIAQDVQWTVAGLSGLSKGIKKSVNKTVPEKAVSKNLQKLESQGSEAVSKQVAEVKKALNI
jgi:hypothetical protein